MRPTGDDRFLWPGYRRPASARADDLVVDNVHGDDTRNGRDRVINADLKGPVRSLTRGLAMAQPGDRVVMSDTGVPYRESVTLSGGRNNGLGSRPFVIEGNGAILEGSAAGTAEGVGTFPRRACISLSPAARCRSLNCFSIGPPVDRPHHLR